jgi:hypothetical protein
MVRDRRARLMCVLICKREGIGDSSCLVPDDRVRYSARHSLISNACSTGLPVVREAEGPQYFRSLAEALACKLPDSHPHGIIDLAVGSYLTIKRCGFGPEWVCAPHPGASRLASRNCRPIPPTEPRRQIRTGAEIQTETVPKVSAWNFCAYGHSTSSYWQLPRFVSQASWRAARCVSATARIRQPFTRANVAAFRTGLNERN